MHEIAHDIRLRDIRGGELVVTYTHMAEGHSYTAGRHVSARLPVECLTIFTEGVVVTDEERQWLTAESAARSNTIDFDGVDV